MSISRSNSSDNLKKFDSIINASKKNPDINKTIGKSFLINAYKNKNISDTDIATLFRNLVLEKAQRPPKMGWIEYARAYARGSEDPSILNFRKVDDTVFRSAAPFYAESYKRLKSDYNVNTIIDLRGLGTTKQENIDWAKQQAKDAGIPEDNYIHIPIYNSKEAPKPEDLDKALEAIRAAKGLGKSVLIYCRHGIDRTGTFVACYQAKELGMKKSEVIKHMRDCGYDYWFHEQSRPAQMKAVLSFFNS